MQTSFAKPSSDSRSVDLGLLVLRVTSSVSLAAAGVWLGGLVALGALVAPVVFRVVSYPANADAMTLVFRRFDLVAMGAGATMLATEAVRLALGVRFARSDRGRAAATVLAACLAAYEGTRVSPRIAALHAGGAIRGLGERGVELARLHDLAETLGKLQLALLVAVIALHVIALTSRADRA
jgi:hypothetical protein